jgi:hypothetical protein
MQTYAWTDVKFHWPSTSLLDAGEWTTLSPGRWNNGENSCGLNLWKTGLNLNSMWEHDRCWPYPCFQHTIIRGRNIMKRYSAFGKSLYTYKGCWMWCPRASIQVWTHSVLFANTFCRSACEMFLMYAVIAVFNSLSVRGRYTIHCSLVHSDFPKSLYFHHSVYQAITGFSL